MNKQDFPIFSNHPDLIYLDNAATTQKPQIVIDTERRFYESDNANVHRGLYDLSEKATQAYEDARSLVAHYFKAKPAEIIFTSGTTAGLNQLAHSLALDVLEDEYCTVLSTVLEHHASILPWQQAVRRTGSRLELVGVTQDLSLDLDDLKSKLEKYTVKILALTHISNVTGTITPIKEIARIVRNISPKTLIIVDGAQSAAHIDLDLHDLDVDFYCCSGHKIYGPTGIGVTYGKSELLQKIDPGNYGGGVISKVERLESTWANPPAKFEAGTPNIAGAIALGEAIRFLGKIGIEKIKSHEQEVANYLFAKLSDISDIQVFSPQAELSRSGVISFNHSQIHAHDLAQLLADKGVCVRAGHHCNQILMREVLKVPATVRASIAMYNDYSDVDLLIEALTDAIGEMS